MTDPVVTPAPAVYLVALADGPSSVRVLDMACGLSAALGGPAELHVLHVTPTVDTPMTVTDVLDSARQLLARALEHAAERFHGKLFAHLEGGQPWRAIMQMAASLRADLIVVGSEGELGPVAEPVVRGAGCPVLVSRPKDYESYVGEGIEPACPDCMATRKETARARMWCERHGTHHPRAILHYDSIAPFAVGASIIRP